MAQVHNIFHLQLPNQVAMFARLFCAVFAIQLLFGFAQQLRYFNTQPARIYGQPLKLLGFIQLPAISKNMFIIFGGVLLFSLICVVLGFNPRLFICIALCSYFPYFNSIKSLAYIQRKTNLLPLILLILTVSPSINHSLDSPSMNWELTLVKITISQMYLSAGIQKLRLSGLSWCNGKGLQATLIQNYMWSDSTYAYKLAQKPALCALVSILTLLFELSFWLVIFFPQLNQLYVAAALFFHLGTFITMRINYIKYLSPVYMVFFTEIAFYIKNHLPF